MFDKLKIQSVNQIFFVRLKNLNSGGNSFWSKFEKFLKIYVNTGFISVDNMKKWNLKIKRYRKNCVILFEKDPIQW